MTRSDTLGRDLALGFVAGALAVPIFLQLTMAPVAPLGVPTIFNQMFWGGVWGLVFVLILNYAPRHWPLWLVGLLLGAIALPVVGWFVVAPIKGNPIAAGWNPTRMLASVIINGFWGIGLALIYMLLQNLVGARSTVRT